MVNGLVTKTPYLTEYQGKLEKRVPKFAANLNGILPHTMPWLRSSKGGDEGGTQRRRGSWIARRIGKIRSRAAGRHVAGNASSLSASLTIQTGGQPVLQEHEMRAHGLLEAQGRGNEENVRPSAAVHQEPKTWTHLAAIAPKPDAAGCASATPCKPQTPGSERKRSRRSSWMPSIFKKAQASSHGAGIESSAQACKDAGSATVWECKDARTTGTGGEQRPGPSMLQTYSPPKKVTFEAVSSRAPYSGADADDFSYAGNSVGLTNMMPPTTPPGTSAGRFHPPPQMGGSPVCWAAFDPSLSKAVPSQCTPTLYETRQVAPWPHAGLKASASGNSEIIYRPTRTPTRDGVIAGSPRETLVAVQQPVLLPEPIFAANVNAETNVVTARVLAQRGALSLVVVPASKSISQLASQTSWQGPLAVKDEPMIQEIYRPARCKASSMPSQARLSSTACAAEAAIAVMRSISPTDRGAEGGKEEGIRCGGRGELRRGHQAIDAELFHGNPGGASLGASGSHDERISRFLRGLTSRGPVPTGGLVRDDAPAGS